MKAFTIFEKTRSKNSKYRIFKKLCGKFQNFQFLATIIDVPVKKFSHLNVLNRKDDTVFKMSVLHVV